MLREGSGPSTLRLSLSWRKEIDPVFLSPPFTPFRMARYAIHIRPSSKAGFCPIYSELRFIGGKTTHYLVNGLSIRSYAQILKRRQHPPPEEEQVTIMNLTLGSCPS